MAVEKNHTTKLWEAQIGGRKFEFERYGALEATELLFDLGAITGKPLGGLAQKAPGDKTSAAEATTHTFALVIEKLADALTTHRQLALKLLLKLSSGDRIFCSGAKVGSFDTFYAEDLMLAFDVARHNLEVQYGNFFGAALSRLGIDIKAAQPLPASSAIASNG